jgi:predicted nucleic acid-binding protein
MRFWDASAIVPLLLEEATSAALRRRLADDRAVVVWWGTWVECTAALVRARRYERISESDLDQLVARLGGLANQWQEVQPGEEVRSRARRLLRTHEGLRAAEAFQLAAALAACEDEVESLDVLCADGRLRDAARREGFRTLE